MEGRNDPDKCDKIDQELQRFLSNNIDNFSKEVDNIYSTNSHSFQNQNNISESSDFQIEYNEYNEPILTKNNQSISSFPKELTIIPESIFNKYLKKKNLKRTFQLNQMIVVFLLQSD